MLRCALNCYGDGAQAVELPASTGRGDGLGVPGLTEEACRDYCIWNKECEGIVYGGGKCHGKKNIVTSKCQPGGTKYWTEVFRNMPKAICGLFGDPHIMQFDAPTGDTIDQFQAGEYVLVRSSTLQINGRFGYSKRFPKEASTVGLAVTGTLIGSHKLVIQYYGPEEGYKGFKVFWDGTEILADFPSTFKSHNHVLSAERGSMDPDDEHPKVRHTIGGAPGSGELPSYRFKFLPDWKIFVLMGRETMNAVIEVQYQDGGFDGYCGSFNCDASDDNMAALYARGLAAPVPPDRSLFSSAPKAPHARSARSPPPNVADVLKSCDKALLPAIKRRCSGSGRNYGTYQDCVFDACAANSTQIAKEDAELTRVEQSEAVKFGAMAQKFLTGLFRMAGPALPWQGLAGIALLAPASLFVFMLLGRASRGSLLDGAAGRLVRSWSRVSASPPARECGGMVAFEHAPLLPSQWSQEDGGEGLAAADEEEHLLA